MPELMPLTAPDGVVSPAPPADGAGEPGAARPRPTPVARDRGKVVLGFVLLFAPVLLLAWMGWQHRWTSDDGFINLRIVRQLRAGNGPVYNVGDRVEVGTSPLWLAVLYVLDVVTPIRLEWIAALTSLAATAGALTLAVLGTRRAVLAAHPSAGWLLPLGALVYAVLPPAWDFATSGLETGIGLLWIGTCWWFLAKRAVQERPRFQPPWYVLVVVGLGPLVRPDFAVFSAFFVVALLVTGPWRLRPIVRVIVLAAAVPVLVELARMAYYGSLAPNTAIAKEASLTNWPQGWLYLRDFVGPYLLVVPLVVLLVCFGPLVRRPGDGRGSGFRAVAGLVIAAGVVHALFVVRVGGDFMHARMLLPAVFTMLLPVSVVVVSGARWLVAAAVVVWAVACGYSLRPSYSAPAAFGPAGADHALDVRTGISDERLYYLRFSQSAHPVTIDDYARHNPWARAGEQTRALVRHGRHGLLVDALHDQHTLLRLRPGVEAAIVASAPSFGVYGYAAGDSVSVVDDHGLADPVAAHQRLAARGRPGHEKDLPEAWVVARFADPAAPIPHSVARADVRAARHALTCGRLGDLLASSEEGLDMERALTNLVSAPANDGFRFSANPTTAEGELCGG